MLVTNHVLAGALIGAASPGPASAFVAGFGSHFAMDVVPHWGDDSIFLQVAVPDGLVGATTMALLFRTARGRRLRVAAGMAGAVLPDLDKPANLFFGRSPFPERFDRFHGEIQRESTRRLPQEFVVAALLGLACRRWVTRGVTRGVTR